MYSAMVAGRSFFEGIADILQIVPPAFQSLSRADGVRKVHTNSVHDGEKRESLPPKAQTVSLGHKHHP